MPKVLMQRQPISKQGNDGAQTGNIKHQKAIAGPRHHGGRPAVVARKRGGAVGKISKMSYDDATITSSQSSTARISRPPLSSGEQWSRRAKRIGAWVIAQDPKAIGRGARPRRPLELASRPRQ